VALQLEQLLGRHKGNVEVFLQVAVSPTQKATMRLDRERMVKASRDLVDDLEQLLGSGGVQLCGLGTRRRKRVEQQQQPLFKEAEEAGDLEATGDESDEQVAAAMDAELETVAAED
jgi:hypothetical protein